MHSELQNWAILVRKWPTGAWHSTVVTACEPSQGLPTPWELRGSRWASGQCPASRVDSRTMFISQWGQNGSCYLLGTRPGCSFNTLESSADSASGPSCPELLNLEEVLGLQRQLQLLE